MLSDSNASPSLRCNKSILMESNSLSNVSVVVSNSLFGPNIRFGVVMKLTEPYVIAPESVFCIVFPTKLPLTTLDNSTGEFPFLIRLVVIVTSCEAIAYNGE